MSKKYLIIKTENGVTEVLDVAPDLQEAKFYRDEYQREYGIKTSVSYKLNPDYKKE